MLTQQIIRRFLFPVIILTSILLSASSWPSGSQKVAVSKPHNKNAISDIRPTYEWGAYLSGISKYNYDDPAGMVVDTSGNLFVLSTSIDSPQGVYTGQDPSQIHIYKVLENGNLAWQIILDTNESSVSRATAIALDKDGNIFVAGSSNDVSSKYYTGNSNNLFVAKFDLSGNFIWTTTVEISEFSTTLSTDVAGNIYIAGEGEVKPYDGTSTIANFTLAKLNPQGDLEWIKSFGNFEFYDIFTRTGFSAKVDPNGFIYVIGDVNASWGEPINSFAGPRDIFVAKFDNAGSLLWNTFLGLNTTYISNVLDTLLSDIQIDKSGDVYITGDSDNNWGNPIMPFSGSEDNFLAKVDANGNLLWNTFIGGADGSDNLMGVAISADNSIYIVGNNNSTWGEPITPFTFGNSTYLAQFEPSGVLLWNTFIAGTGLQFAMADESSFYFLARNGSFLPESATILGTDYDDDNHDLFVAKLILSENKTYRASSPLAPEITRYIPTPLDISTDPKVIGTNIILAVFLMLPFAVAVDKFSRIVSENEEHLEKFAPIAWIAGFQKRLRGITTNRANNQGQMEMIGFLGVIAVYGLVFSLLDNTWDPFSAKGLALFFSMAFAFGVVGILDDIIQWRVIRKWGRQGEFTLRPINLFLAVISTTISRLLALAPGLMFGAPEVLKIKEDELSTLQNRALAKISMLTYVIIAFSAWLPTITTALILRQDISDTLQNIVAGIEAFLLVIFAVALENVFVQLIGISEGLGQKMKAWNKWVWGISLTISTFAFLHTLLNPHYDFVQALRQGNILVFMLVTASFIFLTVFLSLYIRYRNRPTRFQEREK